MEGQGRNNTLMVELIDMLRKGSGEDEVEDR